MYSSYVGSSDARERRSSLGARALSATEMEELALSEVTDSFPMVSRSDALRFLRARAPGVRNSIGLLANDLEWRKKYLSYTTYDTNMTALRFQIPIALPSGAWRALGTTADGCAVLWVQTDRWRTWEYTHSEFVCYVLYFLEGLREMSSYPEGETAYAQFVVIFDLSGWGAKHSLQLRKVRLPRTVSPSAAD